MSSNHHKLYLDDIFTFAKTLSIKSEYSAAQINARLIQLHGPQIVDNNQPSTWKYYRNRCGLYHSTDEQMQVISLDTLQSIEFNKDNLLLHPATAREYQYGSRYYKELVARYPAQESLILGILYPAQMAQALSAPDFSILSYNKALVEPNEETLIADLDAWSRTYKRRWFVGGFNTVHSLYAASFFGVYYQAIPLRVLELRERACGTPQAHSFHVRMHLAGHNGLDEFMPYLTQSQVMYLYRNAAWHQKHAGQKRSFDALVQHLLTERGLPLIGYNLIHSTEGLTTGQTAPVVGFVAEAINKVRSPSAEIIEPQAILSKIAQSADGNEEYNLREPDAIAKNKYSLQNEYPTKVLESTFVDVSEGSAVTSVEMALSLWVYAACTDRFNVYVRVNNPDTGVEVTLSSLDAYYMFLHAYASAHSSGLPKLPELFAAIAPQWPVPSLESLWGITIQDDVSQGRVELLRSLMPQPRSFINLEQFRAAVDSLQEARAQQEMIAASADTFERQASYKSVLAALWQDREFTRTETGTDTNAYLVSKDIAMGALQPGQWQELYLALFKAVTGLDMQATAAQSSMQKAMISIMRRLSSYTVLFVDPQVSSVSRALGWSNLIVQETPTSARSYYEVSIHNADIRLISQMEQTSYAVSIGGCSIGFSTGVPDVPVTMDNTSSIIFLSEENDDRHQIDLANVGVTPVNDDGELQDEFIFGLQELYEAIAQDDEYFARVPNLWNYDCWPRVVFPETADLNDWVVVDHLNLQVPQAGPTTLGDFKVLSLPQRLRYFSDGVDVVELNGIWSNYGDMEVGAFRAAIEAAIVDPFRLVPFFEEEVANWVPSIGPVKAAQFDPYAHLPDYVEMDTFHAPPLQEQLALQSTGLPLDVDVQLKAMMGSASFGFNQGQQGIDLNWRNAHRQANIGTLTNIAKQAQLAFIQRPFTVDIGKFLANILPIEGFRLTNKTAIYQLTSFVMTSRIASIGKLYTYGLIEMTPWINKVREEHVNLGLIQQVAHVNFALQRLTSQNEFVMVQETPPSNP